MSKEKYNQITGDAYKSYVKSFFTGTLKENYVSGGYSFDDYYASIIDNQNLLGWPQDGPISQEEFINKCKTDTEFSEKWGLNIEERELNSEERKRIYEMEYTNDIEVEDNHWLESKLKTRNIPTKQIILTYNNEKIEIYE